MSRPEEVLRLSADLDAVIAAIPEAVVVVDRDHRIARFNAAAEAHYGRTVEEMIGRPVWEHWRAEDREEQTALLERVLSGEVIGPLTGERWRGDGSQFWVSLTGVPIRDEAGIVIASYWHSRDITIKRLAWQRLEEQIGRFTAAFEASPIGMVVATFAGKHAVVNPAMCRMLGYSEEELLALRASELQHPVEMERTKALVDALRQGKQATDAHRKQLRHKDGHYIWVEETLAVIERDRNSPYHLLIQSREVTLDVEQEQHNRFLLDHDHLTGLLNRRAFEDTVGRHHASIVAVASGCAEEHAAGRGSGPAGVEGHGGLGSLLVIDLDGFKQYNDTYGHAVGDRTLVAVTRPLVDELRGGDVAGRMGGDEFAVLLRESNGREAEQVAARLVRSIGGAVIPGLPSSGPRSVTASIGIADFDPTRSLEQTLHEADRAMYRAKDQGRNCWAR